MNNLILQYSDTMALLVLSSNKDFNDKYLRKNAVEIITFIIL
jgi:hypothetical protein